jgi:GGDEF domain-containing protein
MHSHHQDGRGRVRRGFVNRLGSDPVFLGSALTWFAGLLAVSLLIVGLGVSLIQEREKSRRLAELKAGEQGIVIAQLGAIRERLTLLRSDVLFLRNEYEAALQANGGDAHLAAADIAKRFRNFSQTREAYDEIRFIETSGREAVRVNHNGGAPIVVDEAMLQDKSDRPYFARLSDLDYDEIYVSPLDLNVEDGAIMTPYRPTIRLATPARTGANETIGSIVLNYGAAPMLTSIEEAAELSSGQPMMLNADGYWLLSIDPAHNWGFMFPGHEDARMEALYPRTWAEARLAKTGQVHTEEGLFTYRVIDMVGDIVSPTGSASVERPLTEAASALAGDRGWYVGTFVAADDLEEEIGEPSSAAHIYIALIIGLCVVGSTAGAFAIAESRAYRRMLERLAAEDALTGLANRRSLEDRLGQEIALAQRHHRRVTVAFLDVDGFKGINDDLGHAAGDQALVDIAKVIEANIRSYDVVGRFRAGEPGTGTPLTARIGGDEFVIMFPDATGVEQASSILGRIAAGIRGLSWEGRSVSISVGIAVFPDNGDTRDSLLRAADHAMYAAKTSGRDRIVLAEPSGQAA